MLFLLWAPLVLVALLVLAEYKFARARFVQGIKVYEHYPFVGNWPAILRNLPRMYDWKLSHAERAANEGLEIVQRAGPFLGIVEIHSPRMLEYMLKSNFANFEKGERFKGIFAEFLGNGIFNVDGDEWRAQRKIASHMFSAAKLNNCMLQTFVSHAVTLLDVLTAHQKAAEKGGSPYIDMQRIFYAYTIDSMMRIGFGVQLDSLKASSPPTFVEAFDTLQGSIIWRFLGPPFKYKLMRFLRLGNEVTIARCIPIINEFFDSIVAARKAGDQTALAESSDLLSLFIADAAKQQAATAAGKADGSADAQHENEASPASASTSALDAPLSDKELRDVCANFLIAGRDTTASLLTWMFHELSRHPDIEAKVREEVLDIFGSLAPGDEENNTAAVANITHENLKAAVYLEAVILETLRLHPPVAADNKVSKEACTFPDGTRIPAGKVVAYSPYVFGRLTSIWGADAAEFRPERFLSTEEATGKLSVIQPSQYAFPAFNAGFRLCLGRSMAIMEAKTATAAIMRRFSLREKPGHDAAYKLTVVLSMKHGLPMSVHPIPSREQNAQ